MRKLSILIPSNRPEGLDAFLDSLAANTRIKDDIEVIILVDELERDNYVEYHSYKGIRNVTIHRKPTSPLNISDLQYECLKLAEGEWIMLANDDNIVETPNWDDQIRHAMGYFPDSLSLVYPNDGMFGANLACFPVISRKLIDLVKLFPMPYRRYKVDDTIFHLLPGGRRLYLPNCKFTHLNDKATEGFKLPTGKIYPIEAEAAAFDELKWAEEGPRRSEMSRVLNEALGVKEQKVLVGVPTVEMARRAQFYDYLNLLEKPIGTVQTMAHGQSPAKNRNLIIAQALQHNCSHVLFIDDDMAFEPDMLMRLLAHDKDIVTGYYLMRNYPHKPLIFDARERDGSCRPYWPRDDEHGLIKIVNAGLGACLIKTTVFQKMPQPWITLGELTKDEWCDDISFFNRARDLGFEMYCDLDCLVGHMASVTIRPAKMNGDVWHTTYDTTGEGTVAFPQVRPQVEVPK
jgi:glycosyltransferase involved in cell wall biosynthesis